LTLENQGVSYRSISGMINIGNAVCHIIRNSDNPASNAQKTLAHGDFIGSREVLDASKAASAARRQR
jgi:hypothetical protein